VRRLHRQRLPHYHRVYLRRQRWRLPFSDLQHKGVGEVTQPRPQTR
jgi:hypothetical protein